MTDEVSMTPALDKVQDAHFAVEGSPAAAVGALTPGDYLEATKEAYDLMGQVLSEVGSMYILLGSMLQGTEEDAAV
jgi:hypothetical protein